MTTQAAPQISSIVAEQGSVESSHMGTPLMSATDFSDNSRIDEFFLSSPVDTGALIATDEDESVIKSHHVDRVAAQLAHILAQLERASESNAARPPRAD